MKKTKRQWTQYAAIGKGLKVRVWSHADHTPIKVVKGKEYFFAMSVINLETGSIKVSHFVHKAVAMRFAKSMTGALH